MAGQIRRISEEKRIKGSRMKGAYMEYEQLSLTLEDYQKSKADIRNNLTGIVKSFVRVGWHLARIDASGAYKMDGYKSIAEFARIEYDMTPTGVSQFIKVYNNYSLPGDTPELKEQYREFNFSQLRDMLQIPEVDHEMILPEAKRESIRELRRFNAENENNPDNLIDWKEEKKDDPLEIAIIEFFRKNKELTEELFSSKHWETQNMNGLVEILNPSGNLSFRKGRIFLMMYGTDQGLIINEFGKGKEKISWSEFFRKITEIFADAIDGSRTYQNYFGRTEDETGCDSRTSETGSTAESGNDKGSGGAAERNAPKDLQGEGKGTSGSAETGRTENQAESRTGEADGPAAHERIESGQKSEEHKFQRTKQTTETSKPRNEPKPEAESKPEKSEIAPAQPVLKDVMNAPEEPIEETSETVEGEVIETPEEKVPFGNRWEYLKMQGTFSIALTLAAVISETEYGRLQMADFWDSWLREEVDEEGETFESQTEKEA